MKEQEYIYTIFRERSFSGAAKKLFVSQPALSMAVKKVEEQLGITIFDRRSTPVLPTEEGKVYLQALEQMRSVERAMKEQLADMASLKSGHITVSGENFVSSFILPEVLMLFAQQYDGIAVELVESNSPELRQQLLSESIDLLVAHDFDPAIYAARELFEETVLLAVPADLPIHATLQAYVLCAADIRAGRHKTCPPVDLSVFADQPFLVLKPGNDLCRRGNLLCNEAGFSPKVRIALDQLITAYNLACAGMGLTFVSDILVEKAAAPGCLYYRIDSDFAHRKMCIGWKRNRYLNHAAAAFIETACTVFRARADR